MENVSTEERYDEDVLITTTKVLDNGVNIKDKGGGTLSFSFCLSDRIYADV